MNDLADDLMSERAVYWPLGRANEQGKKGFGTAVEIPCKFQHSTEQKLDGKNNFWMSKTRMYTTHPVAAEGVVWKGLLADVVNPTSPFANPGATEIKLVDDVSDLDDEDVTLYTAFM